MLTSYSYALIKSNYDGMCLEDDGNHTRSSMVQKFGHSRVMGLGAPIEDHIFNPPLQGFSSLWSNSQATGHHLQSILSERIPESYHGR
jgi:hypothetical protein